MAALNDGSVTLSAAVFRGTEAGLEAASAGEATPPLARVGGVGAGARRDALTGEALPALPQLEVRHNGVVHADGAPASADELYDHVIGHLERLDNQLDERASELESRARRLVELQQDAARDARRQAQLQEQASVSGAFNLALTRARDDTRRATEQLTAAMADGVNGVLVTTPAAFQTFAREVDRVMAPLHQGARDVLGIKLSRPSSFKGRRAAFADEVAQQAAGASGGDNYEPEPATLAPSAAPSDRRQRRDN